MSERRIIEPELTWTGDRFEGGIGIVLENGRIGAVKRPAPRGAERLARRAVLPGFVNVHSHAFQRGLRGRGDRFPKSRGSFWTWREAMYGLVGSMDAERLYELSRRAFTEMLAAGITAVGEYHYIHHDASNAGFALDEVVLRAASDAGIRLVLLSSYYRTGGIGQPLEGAQLRFRTDSPKEYWANFDRLSSLIDRRTQSLGVGAHSIRAVPLDDLISLKDEADRRRLVVHMHVEEQPAEVKACEAVYGKRPMGLLNEKMAINDRFCALHCTHTAPPELEAFLAAGGNVCVCPLTEANLGDGIPHFGPEARISICLGTDSNARIDFNEEMRWLEYAQRLSTGTRGVFADESGQCARSLLHAATVNGALALGIDTGEIRPGRPADLIAVDLDAPSLAGWTDDTLLESFVFGAGADVIKATCVGGQWVYGGL